MTEGAIIGIAVAILGSGGLLVTLINALKDKRVKSIDDSTALKIKEIDSEALLRAELWKELTTLREVVTRHDDAIGKWRARCDEIYDKLQTVLDEKREVERRNDDLEEENADLKAKYNNQVAINKQMEIDMNLMREDIRRVKATASTLESKVDALPTVPPQENTQ